MILFGPPGPPSAPCFEPRGPLSSPCLPRRSVVGLFVVDAAVPQSVRTKRGVCEQVDPQPCCSLCFLPQPFRFCIDLQPLSFSFVRPVPSRDFFSVKRFWWPFSMAILGLRAGRRKMATENGRKPPENGGDLKRFPAIFIFGCHFPRPEPKRDPQDSPRLKDSIA